MAYNTTEFDTTSLERNSSLIKLGLMAAKIAFYNYELRFNTLVFFNMLHLVSIDVFFKNYCAIIVKRGKFVPKNRPKFVQQFVLFGIETAELIDMVQWLLENKYDNTAKFTIVCASLNADQCDEQALIESMGEVSISNVVFLRLSYDETPEGYTIYPLRSDKCWNKEAVKIDELFYDCENDFCYRKLFPEKYHNLYKCPFSIATIEQPPYMHLVNDSDGNLAPKGGDGDILNLVINMLNGTLVLKVPEKEEWGRFTNNNWTGCLGEVFNNRAQAGICSCPLTVGKHGNFQISSTYDSMDMVWGASMPPQKPSWEKLMYPLPRLIRIILLFMFIAIIFINTFTKTKIWYNIMKVVRSKPTKSNLLIYSWAIFLGMPVSKLPDRFPFRLILISWIWYCLIIRSLYQATLVGSLKLRAYDDKLENFSDVLTRKLPYGGQTSLKEYFYEDRDIYDNWHHVSAAEIEGTLDKVSKGETNLVLAINRETIFAHLMDHHGARQMQILPQKIVNSPAVIFFKKNSHLCPPVNKLLTVCIESGFSQRLYNNYRRYMKELLNQPISHRRSR